MTESLLASSPSDFGTFLPVIDPNSMELSGESELLPCRENLSKTCFSVLPPPEDHSPPQMTSRGCRLSIPLFRHEERSWYGCLACLDRPSFDTLLLCVMLRQDEGNEYRYERDWDTSGEQGTLICLHLNTLKDFRYASIYVTTSMEDHWHAFASSVQDEGHSLVQLVIDPALCHVISHELLDHTEARLCAVNETPTTHRRFLPPPDASDWYHGKQNDNFQFHFAHIGGLNLIVVVYVHLNHNPYFTADIGPGIKSPDVRLDPLLPPPSLPKSQPLLDRSLDRETLRIQHPTDGNDPTWAIHVSIRRAGKYRAGSPSKQRMLFTTNVKKYVLELTQRRLPLS